jgi:hypothetical protein
MRIPGRPESEHLTYCTNVHPGELLPEVIDALRQHLPGIRRETAADRPFGLGLRLAASAAEALQDPAQLEALSDLLETQRSYLFTINGFPFGAFHGRRVKENVYSPDWGEEERLVYTNRLADILARLIPDGVRGSISTVPLSFRPWVAGRLDVITRNLFRHVAHLVEIERTSGRAIALALEPEPCCYLETIEETRAYFEEHLFTRAAAASLAAISGLSEGDAEQALRRHVGVCYDVCHAAVEFEEAGESIAILSGAGIAVPKLQLSSAIRIPELTSAAAEWLKPFDEPVYLHQVVERRNGALRRYVDLPDALANAREALGAEWRVHFHVPVFQRDLEHFSTTQDFLEDILRLHRAESISEHLEVETYTWSVLPAAYRSADLGSAIARELNWIGRRLAQ